MKIFWTMLASQDRKRIREYIAEQNLMAAIELDERIGYSASNLPEQPYKELIHFLPPQAPSCGRVTFHPSLTPKAGVISINAARKKLD
ncbi:type II toxin-antitoxin system RelE/ParE family toxin [Escherichia coli]|uniref:type II toxin-antitoxin system RelE/ParE family toxin n=1 Tax=Escherichia coli TaxID=562 RepID=UPI0035B63670